MQGVTPIFITKVPLGEEGPEAGRQARSGPHLLYDRGSQGRELCWGGCEPEKKASGQWVWDTQVLGRAAEIQLCAQARERRAPAERLLWPGRASPSASQLLAFSPGKEQAAGVWET